MQVLLGETKQKFPCHENSFPHLALFAIFPTDDDDYEPPPPPPLKALYYVIDLEVKYYILHSSSNYFFSPMDLIQRCTGFSQLATYTHI